MKWASAIAEGPDLAAALDQCANSVAEELGPATPASLAVVFVSADYAASFNEVPSILQSHLSGAAVIGCSAAGVIGNGQEIEHRRAVALTAAHLPGVRLTSFRATQDTLPTPDDPPDAWVRLAGVSPEDHPQFLILMDPYSTPGGELLSGLDFAFPAAAKAGGLASGGSAPGSHALYLGQDIYQDGAVGVTLTGDVVMDTIVAQGCRPIGEPKRITKCQHNNLLELDDQPPIIYLQEMYRKLPPRDQALVSGNLFLGIAIDPLLTLDSVRPGDFLIRNLIGTDQERGILAIGEHLQEGQLVQFHVRDAVASTEDLQIQLTQYLQGAGAKPLMGALMFQCNGRGIHLYGRPNHDSDLFRERMGSIPIGGFFCNGEIGPVGGTTYLHGHTSSFALFRKP